LKAGASLEQPKEIEIRKILNVLLKRSWVLLLIVIMTTSASAIYNYLSKPIPLYQTSASLIIQDNSSFINTLKVFVKEPPVLENVIKDLNLNRSMEGLSNQIDVQTVQDSQIVKIIVIDPDPNLSAKIANKTAQVFKDQVATALNFDSIEILSNRMIKIGLVLGVIIGIGFIFLLDSLDNKIRSERDLEKLLETPVLGTVSKYKKKTLLKSKYKKIEPYLRGEISES
jgi:capsular polysaccharide biosynthesis protein